MALKTIYRTIVMKPVVYFGEDYNDVTREPLPHPPDEFKVSLENYPVDQGQHLIKIPNLPATARLVTAWWTPLDKINNLSLFESIDVDVHKPDNEPDNIHIFLDARLDVTGGQKVYREGAPVRLRLKVYVLYEHDVEIKKEGPFPKPPID